MNISFYIRFAYFFSKIYIDYYWVLSYLKEFYVEDDISDLILTGTNCEKALIWPLKIIFPQTKYRLYLCYIDKNILANCKLLFNIEEI